MAVTNLISQMRGAMPFTEGQERVYFTSDYRPGGFLFECASGNYSIYGKILMGNYAKYISVGSAGKMRQNFQCSPQLVKKK
jgi:hypothetical protein